MRNKKLLSYKEAMEYFVRINNNYGNTSEGAITEIVRRGINSNYGEMVDAFILQLAVWDNYRKLVPDTQTAIKCISRIFKEDRHCRKSHPLGDFKDYKGLSVEETYNAMKNRAENVFTIYKGRKINMMDFIYMHLKRKMEILGLNQVDFTQEIVVANFSAMLARTIKGIKAEEIALLMMQDILDQHGHGWRAVLAPPEMEREDVDIIVYNRKGKVKEYVSVKTGNAFADESLRVFKDVKKKTLPTLYVNAYRNDKTKRLYLEKKRPWEF